MIELLVKAAMQVAQNDCCIKLNWKCLHAHNNDKDWESERIY